MLLTEVAQAIILQMSHDKQTQGAWHDTPPKSQQALPPSP